MANYFNPDSFTISILENYLLLEMMSKFHVHDIPSELQNLCLFFPHATNMRKGREWGHKGTEWRTTRKKANEVLSRTSFW
ncbi:hypothetical protein EUGRSUZ_D01292 [Eucalyptus grandis]|uniref:Uncharacterized protein n=2 Tax=Eucalyptus grandis TaxID=71139 RepID=A0A059CFE1_EUCGR|nr:hypothetical protein EUGRSUZ_D01292 [Eucalyptus grandis]